MLEGPGHKVRARLPLLSGVKCHIHRILVHNGSEAKCVGFAAQPVVVDTLLDEIASAI